MEEAGGTRAWVLVTVVVAVAVFGFAAFLVINQEDRLPTAQPPVLAADAAVGAPPHEADILVIGDSVTFQSTGPITTALEARGAVSVIGLPGYRTDELLPTVQDALGREPPPVVVMMSGYNELWQKVVDHSEVVAAQEETIDLLSRAGCAVWVQVPTRGAWDEGTAAAFDDRMAALADDAGVHVESGWRDAVDAGPDGVADPALISPDEIHPTDAGEAVLGAVVGSAVERYCGDA